jgi:hypothetical protein
MPQDVILGTSNLESHAEGGTAEAVPFVRPYFERFLASIKD